MDDFEDIPDLVSLDTIPSLVASAPSTSSAHPNESTSQASTDTSTPSADDQYSQAIPSLPSLLVENPIPLTILTGWLGSGKTTLLHNILDHVSSQGKTVAILQNETSSFMGVEKALQIQDDSGLFGEVLEVRNGCVCCSVRSDFLLAIYDLLSKKAFDYMVLECSGIADVGNLITSVWADKESETGVYLDGVICVVDGQQILTHTQWDATTPSTLSNDAQGAQGPSTVSPAEVSPQPSSQTSSTAPSLPRSTMVQTLMNQLVYADVILVNKMDTLLPEPSTLASALDQLNGDYTPFPSLSPTDISNRRAEQCHEASKLSSKLGTIVKNLVHVNPSAVMYFTTKSQLPIASLLDLSRYGLTSENVDERSIGFHQRYLHKASAGAGAGAGAAGHHPSSSEGAHTGLNALAVSDLPTLTYQYKGIIIHTNNDKLISSKYLVDKGTEADTSDHGHHHHTHDDGHDHTHSHDSDHHDHHHDHHHDSHADPAAVDVHTAQADADPHGISTLVLQLHAKDFASPEEGSQSVWGLDHQKLKVNLDELLFSEIQKSMEQEWATERAVYRSRVAQGEDPAAVVDAILKKEYLQDTDGQSTVSDLGASTTQRSGGEIMIRDELEEVIYRMKGVFAIQGQQEKYYLQAVYNMFDLATADRDDDGDQNGNSSTSATPNPQDVWQPNDDRYCSIIVIGANLRIQRLLDTFLNSLPSLTS